MGIMIGTGLGITLLGVTTEVHNEHVRYVCTTEIKGDSGFTVEADGQTLQCITPAEHKER